MEIVLDSRQLRTCAVCFDLTVGLMRVSCEFLLKENKRSNVSKFVALNLPKHDNFFFFSGLVLPIKDETTTT